MLVTIRRLLHTERMRLLVLSGAMALWFLLVMALVRGMAADISAQSQMFGSSITKGFGIGSLATPDSLLAQMAAVSFNHPIVLAIVGAVTVAFGARACQGELAQGTLDVTLGHSLSRSRYLLGYVVVIAVSVVVLMSVAWAAMIGFDHLLGVPGTLDPARAAITCANGAAVFFSFGAIALLVSVLLGRRGNATFVTLGILVAMYATTFAERISSSSILDVLGPISVFHWFDPSATLLGTMPSVADYVVPLASAAACVVVALWRFERRDL